MRDHRGGSGGSGNGREGFLAQTCVGRAVCACMSVLSTMGSAQAIITHQTVSIHPVHHHTIHPRTHRLCPLVAFLFPRPLPFPFPFPFFFPSPFSSLSSSEGAEADVVASDAFRWRYRNGKSTYAMEEGGEEATRRDTSSPVLFMCVH